MRGRNTTTAPICRIPASHMSCIDPNGVCVDLGKGTGVVFCSDRDKVKKRSVRCLDPSGYEISICYVRDTTDLYVLGDRFTKNLNY